MLDVRERDGAVTVSVRVRPRSRPSVSVEEEGLVISVAAPPERGRATEEARRALAEALGVPPSAVALRTSAAARQKLFSVTGVEAAEARSRLLRTVSG